MTPTISEAVADINDAIASGNFERAVAGADSLLIGLPDCARVLRARAHALERMGDIGRALEDYHRVLEILPTDHRAMVGAGRCLLSLGEGDKAAELGRQALEYDHSNRGAQGLLSVRDASEAHMTAGADIEEARQLFKAGMRNRAIKILRRKLASAPDRTDLQVLHADMLWRQGNRVAASTQCHAVLYAQPDCLPAHAILAALWREANAPFMLRQHVAALKRLDPDGVERREWGESKAVPLQISAPSQPGDQIIETLKPTEHMAPVPNKAVVESLPQTPAMDADVIPHAPLASLAEAVATEPEPGASSTLAQPGPDENALVTEPRAAAPFNASGPGMENATPQAEPITWELQPELPRDALSVAPLSSENVEQVHAAASSTPSNSVVPNISAPAVPENHDVEREDWLSSLIASQTNPAEAAGDLEVFEAESEAEPDGDVASVHPLDWQPVPVTSPAPAPWLNAFNSDTLETAAGLQSATRATEGKTEPMPLWLVERARNDASSNPDVRGFKNNRVLVPVTVPLPEEPEPMVEPEPISEPFFVPIAIIELIPEAVPEPAPLPIPKRAPRKSAAEQLALARHALARGHLVEAATAYRKLVARNQLVSDVISDLSEFSITTTPSSAICQILGDSLMREGHTDRAIAAYALGLAKKFVTRRPAARKKKD